MVRARELTPSDRRRAVGLSLVCVVCSGTLAWTLVFAGLDWGLLLGGLTLPVALGVLARRRPHRRALGLMLGFAIAFVLLTWPSLWIAVGYVRYLITGEPIEND